MDELLAAVKTALLITADNDTIDSELNALALAAIADLATAGIDSTIAETTSNADADAGTVGDETDPRRALYWRGVILFCKAHFLDDVTQAERAQKAYDVIKICMANDADYKEVTDE